MKRTYEYLKEIIEDINREIKKYPYSPNIGKKGCLARLETLKIIMEKEMKEIKENESVYLDLK